MKRSKESKILNSLKRRPEIKTPIASDMFLPNHSGVQNHPELKDKIVNWDIAYAHSQDNSQAHSDYLLNNANDITTGTLTMAAAYVDSITINNNEIYTSDGEENQGAEDLTIFTGDGGDSSPPGSGYNGGDLNLISGNGGGLGPSYAGDINIEAGSGNWNGDINILTNNGSGANAGDIYIIAGNDSIGGQGEIHIMGTASGGDAGTLWLQEDAGEIVAGDTSSHSGVKFYVQGDDGGLVPSPSVCQFLGGTARTSEPGGDSIFEATDAGSGNEDGGNILFRPGTSTGTGTNGSCKFGVATTTNYAEIQGDGDLLFHGTAGLPFAEIYVADGSTAQTIGTGSTYTKGTAFTTNGQSNNCTADASNDKITITKLGKYKINLTLNGYIDKSNTQVSFAIFKGGTIQNNIKGYYEFIAANKNCGGSACGIIDVTSVPVDIDLRFRHDDGGDVDITCVNSNLNVLHIGGT